MLGKSTDCPRPRRCNTSEKRRNVVADQLGAQVPCIGNDLLADDGRLIHVSSLEERSREDRVALNAGPAVPCPAQLYRALSVLPCFLRLSKVCGGQIAEGAGSVPEQATLVEVEPAGIVVTRLSSAQRPSGIFQGLFASFRIPGSGVSHGLHRREHRRRARHSYMVGSGTSGAS